MKKIISIMLLLSIILLTISCHKEAYELYETYTEDNTLIDTTINNHTYSSIDSVTYDGLMITYSPNLPDGVSI